MRTHIRRSSEEFPERHVMTRKEELPLGQVLTVRAVLHGWSIDTEEKLWDDFVASCEPHQLFAGGSMEAAVVYSLDPTRVRRQSLLISNFLMSRVPPESFSLEWMELRGLPSPRLREAAIEAIAMAQHFLQERTLETTHALAGVTVSGSIRPEVKVSADGRRLSVTLRRQELVLSLERLDGQPDTAFEQYRAGIRPGELHDLIADSAYLDWEPVPPVSDLWSGDWTADSGPWRIHVHAMHNSRDPGHSAVMRRLMYALAYE